MINDLTVKTVSILFN